MANKQTNTSVSSVPVLAERIENLIKTVDLNHQTLTHSLDEIKNNTVGQINALQNDKADKSETKDHELRLRSIESKVWKAVGAIAIFQVLMLPILFYLIFKSLGK